MKHDPDYGTIWDVTYATAFALAARNQAKDPDLPEYDRRNLDAVNVGHCEAVADAAVAGLEVARERSREAEAWAAAERQRQQGGQS